MKSAAVGVYIFILAMAIYQVYGAFQQRFNGLIELKARLTQVEKLFESEKLQTLLARSQTLDLAQSVATAAPELLTRVKDPARRYRLRNLASVVAKGAPLEIDSTSALFERARAQFRGQLYKEALVTFAEIIDHHPLAFQVVEAHFLSVEAAYQLHDFSAVVRLSDTMIERYPESVLTGFALIRLARVYNENERPDDAIELLETAHRSYTDPELLRQVRRMLGELTK